MQPVSLPLLRANLTTASRRYAGNENDFLSGGTGSDRLRGEAGFDFCDGGPDADLDVASTCEIEVLIPSRETHPMTDKDAPPFAGASSV